MSDRCTSLYLKYQGNPAPKAFAKGRTRGCGWDKGTTLEDARKRALGFCNAYGGDDCRIVEFVK
ncbi:hypothetical protein GCM10007301_27040 [Azorhizobium oxalatiphilum]|uniref:DUF4189 domain-containing protein n=2 Tax=Azorhizobium oxalatiphilum TaxID=980631 RepID=A0A917C396_9HYPH|nr:hypothetical protein GCM10007301_27040 [Azorhizobium oxalatiphilum]